MSSRVTSAQPGHRRILQRPKLSVVVVQDEIRNRVAFFCRCDITAVPHKGGSVENKRPNPKTWFDHWVIDPVDKYRFVWFPVIFVAMAAFSIAYAFKQ
jgi:hypothetical protein